MNRQIIHTDQAPQAVGTYSQAVKVGDTVYLSGQIPLDPKTMTLVGGAMEDQVRQVFDNLSYVCTAAGGKLSDLVRVGVYLTDLEHFATVNAVMEEYFEAPFPARSAIGVAELPKGAQVEVDAIMVL